jgi:uncharacterized protein
VLIPRDIELQPRPANTPGDFREGIVSLAGQARVLPEQREHIHPLSRAVRAAPLRAVEIKMIPYYAWANRGNSEMTVWMPLVW